MRTMSSRRGSVRVVAILALVGGGLAVASAPPVARVIDCLGITAIPVTVLLGGFAAFWLTGWIVGRGRLIMWDRGEQQARGELPRRDVAAVITRVGPPVPGQRRHLTSGNAAGTSQRRAIPAARRGRGAQR